MKPKTLLLMLLGVALLWGATLLLTTSKNDTSSEANGSFIPGLMRDVNKVSSVVITKGSETWTFERDASSNWSVPAMGGYSADRKKLDTLVLALARAKKIEAKTSLPGRYASLGLEVPKDTEEEATTAPSPQDTTTGPGRVEIFGPSNKSIGAVWIGDRRKGSTDEAYFVRRTDDPTCWVVSGNLRLEAKKSGYLDAKLIEVPAAEMQSVRITHPDGEQVLMARPKEGGPNDPLKILNLPEGKEAQSEYVTSRFASALQSLSFDDVKPAAEVPFAKEDTTQSEYWTADGLHVTVQTIESDNLLYAKFEAEHAMEGGPESFEGPLAPGDLPNILDGNLDGNSEGPSPAEQALDNSEAIAAQAKAITEKASGWVYVLPTWKGSGMRSRMDELLKKEADNVEPFGAPGQGLPPGGFSGTDQPLESLVPTVDGASPNETPVKGAETGSAPAESTTGATDGIHSAAPAGTSTENQLKGTATDPNGVPPGTLPAAQPVDPSTGPAADPEANPAANPAGNPATGQDGNPAKNTGSPGVAPDGTKTPPSKPTPTPKPETKDPVFEIDPDAVKEKAGPLPKKTGKETPDPTPPAPKEPKKESGGDQA